ncbi:hypothetical protein [Clostridium sp. C8-1-8]|uniref:hypothetical protein n=1 Tax=Clostridium sp. C8-1-8 TaxID=2698831 RepID=UPI00136B54B7
MFAYCRNNSVNRIDPDGYRDEPGCGCGGGDLIGSAELDFGIIEEEQLLLRNVISFEMDEQLALEAQEMRIADEAAANVKSKPVSITRSNHVQLRSTQGRNVCTAINDLQRAKRSDILLQEDRRWVVKGQNARIHIIERNGELVTTMNKVTNKNILDRIRKGRWSKLTIDQEEEFIQKFGDYIKWD